MKIGIEVNKDTLEWLIDSLFMNLDTDNLDQIEIIKTIESKQNEN